jgi:hypothetical protein
MAKKDRQQCQNVHAQWIEKRENKMQNSDQKKGGVFQGGMERGDGLGRKGTSWTRKGDLGKSRARNFVLSPNNPAVTPCSP